MEQLQYSFIRSHKSNEIILFIQGYNNWLDKEMNISIEDNKLKIEVNDLIYISDNIMNILHKQLLYNYTNTIIVNEYQDFISQYKLSPLMGNT